MKKRLILNLSMILILLLLYNTKIFPLLLHELVGLLVFALFALHIAINRKWKAAPMERTVTILLGLSFLIALISGIAISHELFSRAEKAPDYWRIIHLAAALLALLLSVAHAIQHRKSLLAAMRSRKVAKIAFVTLTLSLAAFLAVRTGMLLGDFSGKALPNGEPGVHDSFHGKDGEQKP